MREDFSQALRVAVGRDPSLLAYSNPEVVVTTNRTHQVGEHAPRVTIALNEFLAERGVAKRLLELYDTDLMEALAHPEQMTNTGNRIGEDILSHLAAFQQHVFEVIEREAAGRQVIINPYHSVHAEHWKEKGYTVLGPLNEFSFTHARKTVAHEMACNAEGAVPCLGGKVAKNKEEARELFEQFGGDVFVASDDDPFFPDNRRVQSATELDSLREDTEYLITPWKKGVARSPNTQVLIGEKDVLFLGQMNQILKGDTKYAGNIFPPDSPPEVQAQLEQHSVSLAKKLQAEGYRGVVGFDWVETEEGEVFFAETNPRKNRSSAVLFSVLETLNPELSILDLEVRAQMGETVEMPELARVGELYVRMETIPPSLPLESIPAEHLLSEAEVYRKAESSDVPVIAVVNVPVEGTAHYDRAANTIRIIGAGKDGAEVARAMSDLRKRLFGL